MAYTTQSNPKNTFNYRPIIISFFMFPHPHHKKNHYLAGFYVHFGADEGNPPRLHKDSNRCLTVGFLFYILP